RGARHPTARGGARRMLAFVEAPERPPVGRVLGGPNAVQVPPPARGTQLNLADLAHRLAPHGTFASTTTSLAGKLTDGRPLTIFADGRAIVGQTTDPATARALYARYVGA
ncbi:MAG: thiazole biosynthesis adenylyltransferase ThiF, partial [bacterium]